MPEISPSKYLVQAGWDDVPHLNQRTKEELYRSTPPYLREARSKGIPQLGAGAIYPIAWEDVSVDPFQIPGYWRRCYALDVGWKRTAAMWMAEDPSDGTKYAYAEYYGAQEIPTIHATAIKARGEWIPGCIDPASRGRNQKDGTRLVTEYQAMGLDLVNAINDVEAGLSVVWELLATGRLKFFKTLQRTAGEYRIYRRAQKKDENGVTRVKVVKENDHLMDCLRYDVMTFDKIAKVRPAGTSTQGHGSHIAGDRKAGY